MLLKSFMFHELLLAIAALLSTLWKDFVSSTVIEMVPDLRHGAWAKARARGRGTIHAVVLVDRAVELFDLLGVFVKVLCADEDSFAWCARRGPFVSGRFRDAISSRRSGRSVNLFRVLVAVWSGVLPLRCSIAVSGRICGLRTVCDIFDSLECNADVFQNLNI
jgi:hypothetical protein